jgi:hypothetical protein
MADADDERSVHWYYLAGGKEMGPVLIARLRQMARQGLLKPDDLVRRGTTGEWSYAGRVEELASHADEYVAASSAAEDGPDEPPASEAKGPSLGERLSDAFSAVVRSVAERWELVRTLAGYAALGATVFLLVRVTLGSRLFDWSTPPDPLVVYYALWDELQTHRQAQADEAVWHEFSERGRRELSPVVARLESEAGSTNREAQFLLWAGRDCLPKMFDDARAAPSSSERQLAEYLQNVTLLRAGKPIYNSHAGTRAPVARRPSLVRWIAAEPATSTLALLLTATNVALVAWLLRGVLKRRSSDVPRAPSA